MKQPPSSSNCTYTLYIYIYIYVCMYTHTHTRSGIYAFFSGEPWLSLSSKVCKKVKNHSSPPSYCQFHPQPQTEPLLTSRWLPVLYQWPRIFSKPSSNCLLHICLPMLHKHLQLNLYKINTSSAPNRSMFSYSIHSINHSDVQKIRELS